MLANALPGRELSTEFWLERERETDDAFRRLLQSPQDGIPDYRALPSEDETEGE